MFRKKTHRRITTTQVLILAGSLTAAISAFGQETLVTESRMPHHHRITVRDGDGNLITPPPEFTEEGKPQEARGNPYSPAQTCGKCHDYKAISKGWHFNAGKENAKAGRPGEPWIYTDPVTGTQIPLSYRDWKGTFKPADVGLSDFDFVANFARHFPGGGVGDPDKDKINLDDARMRRFLVSGSLEIDCMICHTKEGFDHEARYKALGGENFKWAPTISAGLGAFSTPRPAKAFADSWKPPRPAPTNIPPMKIERGKFDIENHVEFEVARKPKSDNCYYCHTSDSQSTDSRWHGDGDVHMRAGMSCVDCHRNAIDHMITRGYEGEVNDRAVTEEMIAFRAKILSRDNLGMADSDAKKLAETHLKTEMKRVETLSCRGCHYGTESENQTAATFGRLGAPRPEHVGIPPIHFEKLSCTACHSGPFPSDKEQIVQTSLAHKLGLPLPPRGDKTAPIIVQPVFLRGDDNKITPHKAVWPSYWGRSKDGKITPMLPEEAAKLAGDKLPKQTSGELARDPHNSKGLSEEKIKAALEAMAADKEKGEVVYVAAGQLYRLDGGNLKAEEHEAAEPYTWALAHDVRPASQSLGVRGCVDCHAEDAPIYFGSITARGPVDSTNTIAKQMYALRGDDKTLASTFAFTFNFRPMLKYITFGCAFVVFGVLVSYGVGGLQNLTRGGRGNRKGESK